MVKLLKIKRRDFFEWEIFPILVSSTVKARKFKLLYFRNETSFGDGKWAQEKIPSRVSLARARSFLRSFTSYFLLRRLIPGANLRESSHVEKNSGCLLVLLLCLSPLRNVSVISKRDDRNYFLFWANHWVTIMSNVIWLLRSLWNVTRDKCYIRKSYII